ncbi:MAG: ribose 5-phosphate isomerase B [Oscillospiraceae bacterium]
MLIIGCDHAGYALKCEVIKFLDEIGEKYDDFGCNGERAEYPLIAKSVCDAVISGKSPKAILICGTGIGISMAANKVKGIRAAVCSDTYTAKFTRLHNDANVLCMGGRVIGAGVACEIVDMFLKTEFEGGRHQARIDMIEKIENEQ